MLWALAAPIVVGGVLVGPGVLALIKPEAAAAGHLLCVLILSYPFICGNFMVGTVLAATNRQNRNFVAGAIALATNTVLNLASIPHYGAMGAAVATLISQAAYFFCMLHECRDQFAGWSVDLAYYVKALAAALAMGAIVFVLASLGAPVLVQIAAGALAYGLLAAGLRVLSPGDLARLWQQMRGGVPVVEADE